MIETVRNAYEGRGMGVSPVAYGQHRRRHGRDGRATHGQDARATEQRRCCFRRVPVAAAVLLAAAAAFGEVRPSGVISDGCVLQRGVKAPVWGRAEPGEKVTVRFAGQSKSATAGRFGRWRVELDPLTASCEGRTMVIEGAGRSVQVKNVTIGDVWLYLSQSWHLGGPADLRVDSDKIPPICENVPASVWEHQNHSQRPEPDGEAGGRWTRYKTPGRYFRNDGYYLGLGLVRHTKAPAGVVGLGASTLESMTPIEGFVAFEKSLGELGRTVATWTPETAAGKQAYLRSIEQINSWVERTRRVLDSGDATFRDLTQPPRLPGPEAYKRGPTTLYNHVACRFAPAAVRGIIIQPKTYNLGDAQYAAKAKALIGGLRLAFGRKGLPVCFLQMHTPGRYERNETTDPNDWVRMRAAQNELAGLPNTTVLATYDLKAPGRSDPDMGLRAAQWAVAVVEGAAARSGPICTARRVEGGRVVVTFDPVGKGLMVGKAEAGKPVQPVEGGRLGGFQLAGADGKWHDAAAAIQGDTVVVTCAKVARPAAVRYAWSPTPTAANLYNRAGFPALPFERK